MYYQVYQIGVRPLVFLITVVNSSKDISSFFSKVLIAMSILAFVFSIPFLLVKMDEASYTAKIHYPFLMSSALGDKMKRETMLQLFQIVKEEIAICTVFLSSFSEILLILGNLILTIAAAVSSGSGTESTSNEGPIVIGITSFFAAMYAFYCNIIFCMEIMAYKGTKNSCVKGCCGICYACMKPASYEEKNLVGEQKDQLKLLGKSDTKVYTVTDVLVPRFINFRTDTYLGKYTKKNDSDETIIDFAKCQKDVPMNPKTGKPAFQYVDRYGFLTIVGYTQLMLYSKLDTVEYEKKHPPLQENGSPAKGLMSYCCDCVLAITCIPYCHWWIDLVSKYYVAYLYVLVEGGWRVMGWLYCGFDLERALQDACSDVADKAKELELNEDEVKDLKDGTFFDKVMNAQVVQPDGTITKVPILRPTRMPMPWGFSTLSPLKRLHPCCYPFLCTINPFRFGHPAKKYSVSRENMININVISEIILRCDIMIPHKFFNEFPMNQWPLSKLYPYLLLAVANALQKIRDMIELFELREKNFIPPAAAKDTSKMKMSEYVDYLLEKDETVPSEASIEYIKAARIGEAVNINNGDVESGSNSSSNEGISNPIVENMASEVGRQKPSPADAFSKSDKAQKKYSGSDN